MNKVLSFKNVKTEKELAGIIEEINRCGGNVEQQSLNEKEGIGFVTVRAHNEVDFWLEFKDSPSCDSWVKVQKGGA